MLLIPLTACLGSTTDSKPVSENASFCKTAKPIKWCGVDSSLTLVQVLQHNAAGIEICGWKTNTATWPIDPRFSCADAGIDKTKPAPPT